MTNTVILIREFTKAVAIFPWWISLLVLLIILALIVGWAAMWVTKAVDKVQAVTSKATSFTDSISSLLRARARPIAFLLWLLSVAVLIILWFVSDPLTRTTCLLMVLDGGVSFLLLAYLIIELVFWRMARQVERESQERRERTNAA